MAAPIIRPITTADQAFVSAMQYEALYVPAGASPYPRSILDEPGIRRYHEAFGSRDGDVGVIADGLGAAWVRLVPGGYGFVDDDTPELGIAVVPEARGQGVGSALLEALLAAVPRCSLSVDVRNPAMRLYERLGFRVVRRDGDSAVMLRGPRDLPATELLPVPAQGRTYSAERTVRLGDVDVRGELRLDSVARYLQDVATDDALDAGLGNTMGWVVRRTLIRVCSALRLNDRITLTTFCTGSGRSWAERRTSLAGTGGPCVDAVSLWVQVDLDSGRPVRLTDDFHAIYDEAAAGRHVSSKLSLARLPTGRTGKPWSFRRTDLDPFEHVNNAAQWTVMEELLAGRSRHGVGEVEFLAPAGLDHEFVVDGDEAWLVADGAAVTALRWTA